MSDSQGAVAGFHKLKRFDTYRADGMRVSKVSSGTTTRYRYDGQMGMQDVEVTGTTP